MWRSSRFFRYSRNGGLNTGNNKTNVSFPFLFTGVVIAISCGAWILAILAGTMRGFKMDEFYGIIVIAIFLFIPLIVILVAYGKIFQIARAHAHGRGNSSFKKGTFNSSWIIRSMLTANFIPRTKTKQKTHIVPCITWLTLNSPWKCSGVLLFFACKLLRSLLHCSFRWSWKRDMRPAVSRLSCLGLARVSSRREDWELRLKFLLQLFS